MISGADIEGLKHLKGGQFKLQHHVGVIEKDDANKFRRMIFRSSKGNCWTHFIDFDSEIATYTAG